MVPAQGPGTCDVPESCARAEAYVSHNQKASAGACTCDVKGRWAETMPALGSVPATSASNRPIPAQRLSFCDLGMSLSSLGGSDRCHTMGSARAGAWFL